MDWVERRFARERNMENGPKEIWQKVLTAIENACNTFQRLREVPKVFRQPENGHALLVSVEYPRKPFPHDGVASINHVRLAFDAQKHLITATLNERPTISFSIGADEDGCFLMYGQEKIDADRLSEIVLSDALFKRPNPRPQGSSDSLPYWEQ